MNYLMSETPMPSARASTYNLEDDLRLAELNEGIVCIDFVFNDYNARRVMRELEFVARTRGSKTINLYMNSPGGGAYPALAVHDAILHVRGKGVPVICTVEGYAASAAAMIVLQAAEMRLARPNARFLLHEIRRWVFFEMQRASDLKDEVKEMEALTRQILAILEKRCGHPAKEIEHLISRTEVWMSAEEARSWGLIDGVVE